MSFDVLVRGGRLIDPSHDVDAVVDVGVADGRVAAIGAGLPADGAARIVEADGCLVTPGLIDLHSHVYWGGTSLGVDADRLAAPSGTTTYVDAGSAGAGKFLGFRSLADGRSAIDGRPAAPAPSIFSVFAVTSWNAPRCVLWPISTFPSPAFSGFPTA